MKKFFDNVFVFVVFVLPFIFVYSKGLDYYRVTVVEPKIGMKCGDGNPTETWINGEHILTPTYDCMTMEHYTAYAEWFAKAAPAYIIEHSAWLSTVKAYFLNIIAIITNMFYEILAILVNI